MPVRAIFVLQDGITVIEPFHGSAPVTRFSRGHLDLPVRQLRSRTHLPTDVTYEIYAEPMISENEAMRRVLEWNIQHPTQAVPPPGTVF